MSLDGATASFLPYTLNGLQDIAVNSSTVSTLQVNSLTPNRVVVSDGSNFLVSAGATSTEVDYLSGTTSNIQTQINSKASTSYVDTNFLNKTTATQQDITAFCNLTGGAGTGTLGMSNGLQWYKNSAFEHPWVIVRQIGSGSILKDLVFRDSENNVDTLLLSENGQTIYVNLTCNYATPSKIPIFDSNKKLVSSGVDSIKITYLDNVSSDIQTQLNSKLNLSGNNANQDIVISGYKVQSSATPTVNNDYTNKLYVDSAISGLGTVYVLKAGDSMSGALAMGTHKITTSYTPVNADDLTRKGYVDSQDALKLSLTGGVMTGAITGASLNYLRWGSQGDIRNNLAPNYVPGGAMAWYFGTYANDNTGSFADHIIPNGWVDTSGGLTNMLSLNKGGKGIRQFQQTFGSASGFATWYDCVLTDANSADVSIGGVLTAPSVNVSSQTASRVVVFDASKNLVSSSVSSATLAFLDATSSVQNQLNARVLKTGDEMSGALQIKTTGFAPLTLTRTSALANYGVGSIHSLVSTGNFQAYYARSLGGSDGVVATTAQNQANGYYLIDVANAGVFGSDTAPGSSSFYMNRTEARFNVGLNLPLLTASRVLQLNSSGNVESSAVSTTTLSFLDATSSIQTQLNAKCNLAGGNTITGFQTFSDETASRVAVFDVIKRLRASSTTSLELSYLSGTTSSVQTQLDARVLKAGDTMSGELKFTNNVITEWGVGLVKEVNSGKIGYGWVATNSLDIVGGGTVVGERLVSLYDQISTGKATSNVANAYASRASNPLPSNFIASSSTQRLYMGSYYTSGVGTCSTIQASDYYSSLDHATDLLLNPLGGIVGIGAKSPGLNWANTGIPNARLTIQGGSEGAGVGGKARISIGADTRHYSAIEAQHIGSGSTTLTFFTCESAFVNGSNPIERLLIDELGQLNSGVGGNTRYNLKFANSASHLDNNVGEVFLFTAYQGHLGVQRNTTRNSSTACLALGTSPLEKSEILSIRSDNGAYMPMEYFGSLHNFAVGNVGIGTTSPVSALHIARAFITDTDYSGMISFENTQAGGYVEWQMGAQVIGGAGCFGIRGGTDGFSGLSNLLTIRAVSTTACRVGINKQAPEGDLHVQLTGAVDDFWGKLVVKTTSFWGDGCATRSETAGTQYATMFPMMFLQPHVVSASDGWAPIRMGRSGGVSTGRWWEMAVRPDASFQIGVERISQFVINPNGNVGIGTTTPACLVNWVGNVDGGVEQYGQNLSGGGNAYTLMGVRNNTPSQLVMFINSTGRTGDGGASTGTIRNDAGALRLQSTGGNGIFIASTSGHVGIGTGNPTGVLDIYSTTADYTNSLLVRTPWASITLDNTQIGDGRKWSLLSGGLGAGVGIGNFGLFDITGGSYRFAVDSTGRVSLGNNNAHTRVGVMGGNTSGNVQNTSSWPSNANGILISSSGSQGGNTGGLYTGYQNTTGYITCLAPNVSWDNLYISAGITYISYYGTVVAYSSTGGIVNVSDEREKEDIQPLKTDKSLERILALKPKHYRRKYYDSATPVDDAIKERRHVGFIAQEVQKTNPHCISSWCNKDAVKKRDEAKVEIDVEEDEDVKVEITIEEEEDDGQRFGMSYNDYVVHLVGGIQEQQKQIELLSQRNLILEEHARKLEADMAEYKEQTDRRMTQLAELVKGMLEEPKLKRIKTIVRE